jgi:hypothetical protein
MLDEYGFTWEEPGAVAGRAGREGEARTDDHVQT